MQSTKKKRKITDFKSLDLELKKRIRNSYPDGFENNLISYFDLSGKKISVLPFETEETFYLLKMNRTDIKKEGFRISSRTWSGNIGSKRKTGFE